MLAISSGTETLIIYVLAAVIGAAILGFGRAVMKFVQGRQTKQRNDDYDTRTLSEFFFDTPRDPRTGTPAKEGWTTKVDRALQDFELTLKNLADGQARIERAVHRTLSEVIPDGNGGHNLRGAVDRNAKAAGLEVDKQIIERKRVQDRDGVWDENS